MNQAIKYKVLVIEDDDTLVKAIKDKLEKNDFEVFTAATVEEAIKHLENGHVPNAVWLDHYLLGNESGLDFVTKIKTEDSQWKSIPIFVVSNTASPDNMQTYLRLGVTSYYVKADSRLDQIVGDVQKFLETGK